MAYKTIRTFDQFSKNKRNLMASCSAVIVIFFATTNVTDVPLPPAPQSLKIPVDLAFALLSAPVIWFVVNFVSDGIDLHNLNSEAAGEFDLEKITLSLHALHEKMHTRATELTERITSCLSAMDVLRDTIIEVEKGITLDRVEKYYRVCLGEAVTMAHRRFGDYPTTPEQILDAIVEEASRPIEPRNAFYDDVYGAFTNAIRESEFELGRLNEVVDAAQKADSETSKRFIRLSSGFSSIQRSAYISLEWIVPLAMALIALIMCSIRSFGLYRFF